jgi:hypothetical protein
MLLAVKFIVTVALFTKLIVNQFIHLAVVAAHCWQCSVVFQLPL